MPASTDNAAFHPKSVYNRQYSTEGQTQTVSSGAFLLVEKGGTIDNRGQMLNSVVNHTSNSTEISNHGIKLLPSSEDIKMTIAPPVTGSMVKLVMASVNPAKDNTVYTFIVTGAGRFGSTGRQISFTTHAATPLGKFAELTGSTLGSAPSWYVSNAGPGSTDGGPLYTVSSSTN